MSFFWVFDMNDGIGFMIFDCTGRRLGYFKTQKHAVRILTNQLVYIKVFVELTSAKIYRNPRDRRVKVMVS